MHQSPASKKSTPKRRLESVAIGADFALLMWNQNAFGEETARRMNDRFKRSNGALTFRSIVIKIGAGGWCAAVYYTSEGDAMLAESVAKETALPLERPQKPKPTYVSPTTTAAEYKALRKQIGTQEEVAKMLRVTRITIARRET